MLCAQDKTIRGVDRQINGSSKFVWRGCGWLKPFTCPCEVLAYDAECADYAVVYFGSTPFTGVVVDCVVLAV